MFASDTGNRQIYYRNRFSDNNECVNVGYRSTFGSVVSKFYYLFGAVYYYFINTYHQNCQYRLILNILFYSLLFNMYCIGTIIIIITIIISVT